MGQVIFGVDFKRSNPKSDRAFWIGPQPDPIAVMAVEIMNQIFPADTAPSEMNPEDCA